MGRFFYLYSPLVMERDGNETFIAKETVVVVLVDGGRLLFC